ncbi:MAG: hypothetical protein ACM3KR_06380 [Deltaproteobacteria bacterium]
MKNKARVLALLIITCIALTACGTNTKGTSNQIQQAVQVNQTEKQKAVLENGEVLKELINDNWDISKFKKWIGVSAYTANGYEIFAEKGIKITSRLDFKDSSSQLNFSGSKICNLVITNQYKSPVLGTLNVNTDKKDILQIMGKPDFEEKDSIGYKKDSFYIFFTGSKDNKEISIYRKDNIDQDIIKAILQDPKNKFSKIKDKLLKEWGKPDYELESISGPEVLQYVSRGIILGEDLNNNIDYYITIFQNYGKSTDLTTKNPAIEYKSNTDSINDFEYSRIEKDNVYEKERESGTLSPDLKKTAFQISRNTFSRIVVSYKDNIKSDVEIGIDGAYNNLCWLNNKYLIYTSCLNDNLIRLGNIENDEEKLINITSIDGKQSKAYNTIEKMKVEGNKILYKVANDREFKEIIFSFDKAGNIKIK